MNELKLTNKEMKRIYWVLQHTIDDHKLDKNKRLSAGMVSEVKSLLKKFKVKGDK